MRRINLSAPDFEYDPEDPDGFRCGMVRLRQTVPATMTGISVYELPPGQTICPYHYEYAEEEWLLVLEGRPTLRHPEGRDVLEPWVVTFFPCGPDGAHAVTNETGETCRVLMFSNRVKVAATAYPDSDKVGIWTGIKTEDVLVRRSSKVDYYTDEPGLG